MKYMEMMGMTQAVKHAMAIEVRCHTNIDEFKQVEWPAFLLCRPQIGDYIEGRMGETGPGSRPKLRVISITHAADKNKVPILDVELHR